MMISVASKSRCLLYQQRAALSHARRQPQPAIAAAVDGKTSPRHGLDIRHIAAAAEAAHTLMMTRSPLGA